MSDITKLAQEMSQAATKFLDALTSAQRTKANLPFEDEEERRRFYYTPNERGGLPLIEMQPKQQLYAMRLVSSGLTEVGYNAVSTILGLENLLGRQDGWREAPYAGRAVESRFRDPALYFLAVFGAPGSPDGWGWRFGGHHVCIQYTLRDNFIYATPAFFGSHPGVASMPGGKVLRPLAAEEDFARELLAALRPDQLAQAIISPAAPPDIVQSNRPRVEEGALPLPLGFMMRRSESRDAAPRNRFGVDSPEFRAELGLTSELEEKLRYSSTPRGLFGSAMDANQREAMTRLIRLYFDRVPEAVAAQYAERLKPESTAFAWAGSREVGGYHYYRIQSERLLIEYDNTQNGANHIHSVWRDPVADFGGDILARHYAAAH
jgi:hypothetical protein